MYDLLAAYIQKKHGADREVQLVYNDQPENDFKSLFLRINGNAL